MVKQETVRLNIDMLGISELKWMGMGEFNSDDHYIYCCRQVIRLSRQITSYVSVGAMSVWFTMELLAVRSAVNKCVEYN